MSDHADTIREALYDLYGKTDRHITRDAHAALNALVAENQRLKSEMQDMVLAAAYHERVVLHEAAVAENQRLRDALERIVTVLGDLDGTP